MTIIVKNTSKIDRCSITLNGVGMTDGVVAGLKWKHGDMVKVGFIENAACMVFCKSTDDHCFRLAYANSRKKTGGRVYCISFIRGYLKTVYEIPKRNLFPIFLKNGTWQFALILEEPNWNECDFSKIDVNEIGKDLIGVYQLTGQGGGILRIGEGRLYDRLNAHLIDTRFTPPVVRGIKYLPLTTRNDGKIVEKILIQRFENEAGILPKFQEIRA